MNKARHCYVHIGAPKTGSTALQKLLCENRAALADASILYPSSSLRGFGHHDIAYLLGGGYPDYATPQPLRIDEIAAMLAAEVAQHHGSIVLSSENFYLFAQPEKLYAFLERTGALADRTPVIIVYVRRQDDAHESWYNQTIKAQGYTHDLNACIAASYDLWDYDKQLAAWAAVFGAGALVVRPYETRQYNGGTLSRDFLSILDAHVDVLDGKEERINAGINADILEFQRIINKLPMTIQEKRRFHRQLIDLTERSSGSGLFDERPAMDDELRRTLLERYAEGNAKVARTYLGRPGLFLDEPAASGVAAATAPSGLTPEKLALVLGWLLSKDR